MARTKVRFLVSGFLLLLFVLGLLWVPAAQAQLTKLKVAYIPISSLLPLYAALNNGYLQEEGLTVEIIPMAGGAVIIPALVGGSLDIGFSAYLSIWAAREKGIDIKVIAHNNQESDRPGLYTFNVIVLEGSGIKTAKDLEGKTFAVNTLKSLDWASASEWIAKSGGDPTKVTWVELPFPAMGSALRTKKVDATQGIEPFISAELEQGGITIIGHPYPAVMPDMPVAGWIATGSWLVANGTSAEKFVRAINRGKAFIQEQPGKRGELVVKYTRMKPDLAAKLRFYPNFPQTVSVKALQVTADFALKWGLIAKKVEVREALWEGIAK